MTGEPSFSLEDLSAETGFDPRVIRSFIEQDLMLGPTSLGRYARYSESHLVRLLAIKALKEKRGLKISEIRQRLLCMTGAEELALADTARGPDANDRTSALDYIRSIDPQGFSGQRNQSIQHQRFAQDQQQQQQNQDQHQQNQAASPRTNTNQVRAAQQGAASLDAFLRNQNAQGQSARQPLSSEIWHRFQITPDVELSVRGIHSEEQLTRMKNIANQLRELLIGGQND